MTDELVEIDVEALDGELEEIEEDAKALLERIQRVRRQLAGEDD